MSESRYLFILPQEKGSVTIPRRLVFARDLSEGAKILYCVSIALCQNPRWKLNHSGLASVMSCSIRTVKSWARELKDAHWLSIEPERAPDRRMVIGWRWTLRKDPRQDSEAIVRRSDTILGLVHARG
jgi:hypothetical protein